VKRHNNRRTPSHSIPGSVGKLKSWCGIRLDSNMQWRVIWKPEKALSGDQHLTMPPSAAGGA